MRVLVFGGTKEGRKLCDFLKANGVSFRLSVATDYGKFVMDHDMDVVQARMDSEQMKAFLLEGGYHLVIDATHPYAKEVTKHIKQACEATGIKRIRVVRKRENPTEDVISFESHEEVVRYLNRNGGGILLGTGSKDIQIYKGIKDYQKRIFARILPMPDSISACLEAGIRQSNLICMQGPFTKEMDMACIRHAKAKYFVSKNSGAIGGLPEKIAAAKETGTELLLISGELKEEEGLSYEETIQYCKERFSLGSLILPTRKRVPLFMDMKDKRILFVGGGKVAERRIETLIPSGAVITLVSPQATEALQRLAEVQAIEWRGKEYTKEDIEGLFFLVVAATNCNTVNERVWEHSKEKGMLTNIASCKEKSDVWFPSVAENETITAAVISAEGNPHVSRAAIKTIREVFDI